MQLTHEGQWAADREEIPSQINTVKTNSREFHPQTRNKVAEGAVLEILRLGIVLVETAALLRMISLQCAFAMQTATARHWRI